ncbi:homoserine dehydrogenase [Desertibacillus haloalkaliphilus]|uniref:homoserine dehydrogenase n=1 Tax=Desertibacillus haloalkaliphilus TaxID=1328930 RepID=UPI001C269886|nr:homoserine dehydrogenase [Desertibacillus haloalkaliphilus]MBU8907343.1 homoserine dehydrogenase [Desertibacillus haloalkaliphilus]
MTHKIALIGYGGVGQGLVEILRSKNDLLKEQLGHHFSIVSISDLKKGSIHHPNGIDLDLLEGTMEKTGSLLDYPDQPGLIKGWDSLTTIENSNADTVIEITYTDVHTGQPAIDHCKAAFKNGKNVVMSNKGPVALAYQELASLAKENNVRFHFEGTVMSGTPAIRMPLVSLAGNEITEIRGILNGTTNYILTKMEEGMSYDKALLEAQRLGYAEADPKSDVDGYDVMYKVVILANVVMGVPLKKEDVYCRGIRELTTEDIEQARREQRKWKLIGKIKKEDHRVIASVGPEKVANTDPLAGVSGAMNAITYDCDLSGPITLTGAGAGIIETGYSLLIDLINLER